MAVTAANQTFRGGVMPVLLQLDVNLDLPDQDVGDATTEYDSYTAFNYNNPVYFVGMETIRTLPIPANGRSYVGLIGNPTTPFPESLVVPAGTVNLAATSLDRHGQKNVAGLQTSPISALSTTGPIKHMLLFTAIIGERGAATLSGSSFVKCRFVNDNSVVRITA
jgi:hypothetical protein